MGVFGFIAGLFGIGSTIYSASKDRDSAAAAAKLQRDQFAAKAEQTLTAGVEAIGGTQLAIASSGVKVDADAGARDLKGLKPIDPANLKLRDIKDPKNITSSIVGNMPVTKQEVAKKVKKKKSDNTAAARTIASGDTASIILQQSRRAVAADVRTTYKTGQAVSTATTKQAQQNYYSNLFSTAKDVGQTLDWLTEW